MRDVSDVREAEAPLPFNCFCSPIRNSLDSTEARVLSSRPGYYSIETSILHFKDIFLFLHSALCILYFEFAA